MRGNEFVYDYVVLARTKLAKRKRTKGKFRRNFPSTHKPNNELYTLLATVIILVYFLRNQKIIVLFHRLILILIENFDLTLELLIDSRKPYL